MSLIGQRGHVIYMGSWNNEDVWDAHLLDDYRYLFNYVLYPQREALRQKAAERLKHHPTKQIHTWSSLL